MLLGSKSQCDLRVISRELDAHVAKICKVNFADTVRQSLSIPVALQLQKLAQAFAIFSSRGRRFIFVPATQEKGWHLIGRRNLSEQNWIMVNPNKAARGRVHDDPRLTFRNAHPNTVRQNA